MRLALVRRKLVSRSELLLRILLPIATRLLPDPPRLLPLILLIQLSCRSPNLGVTKCLAVIRTSQEYICLVIHLRVVDEDPFVVGLLLVEDSDCCVFALAGYADDRASAERLATNTGIAEDSVVAA